MDNKQQQIPKIDNKGDSSPKMESQKRRRARNDPNNRDYVCSCGKSYLSYPALYTHIKQKHEGKAPGQITLPRPSEKRRGRPKNPQNNQNQDDQDDGDQYSSDSNDALGVIEEFIAYVNEKLGYEENIQAENQSYTLDDIMAILPKENYFKNKQDYQKIYDIYQQINQQNGQIEEQQQDGLYTTKCNTIFALFLYQISKQFKKNLISEIAFFLCLYRKALNERGYELLQQQQQNAQEFCEINTGKDILEISNDFITTLLPEYLKQYNCQENKFVKLDHLQTHIIRLTQCFCNWLFAKRYTNSQLQINDENDDEDEDGNEGAEDGEDEKETGFNDNDNN